MQNPEVYIREEYSAAVVVLRLVEIDSSVVEIAVDSICRVFAYHNSRVRAVKLVLAEELLHPETHEPLEHYSQYHPETNTIMIGTRRVDKIQLSVSLGSKMGMITAHEAMHAVQHDRGEELLPTPMHELEDDELEAYRNYHLEQEAWIEAAHTLKHLEPKVMGRFCDTTGNWYDIPNQSHYDTIG